MGLCGLRKKEGHPGKLLSYFEFREMFKDES